MTTEFLRETFRMTQEEMATRYGIPLRTIQNWDYRDCMPEYVFELIAECEQLKAELAMYHDIHDKLFMEPLSE